MLTRRYYKDDYETETLIGTLTQMLLDVGSFSEGMVPILEGDFGQTPIMATDDETLDQGYLKGLNGQRVQVTGEWQNGVLYVVKANVREDFQESGQENTVDATEDSQDAPAVENRESVVEETDSVAEEQNPNTDSTSLTEYISESTVDTGPEPQTIEEDTIVEFQTVELVKPCSLCTSLSHTEANYCWHCGTPLSSTSSTSEEQK